MSNPIIINFTENHDFLGFCVGVCGWKTELETSYDPLLIWLHLLNSNQTAPHHLSQENGIINSEQGKGKCNVEFIIRHPFYNIMIGAEY